VLASRVRVPAISPGSGPVVAWVAGCCPPFGGGVVTAPIVVTHSWRVVVDAAGCRCECRGECGHKHSDGRCLVGLDAGARLFVAARDQRVPASRAPWLPVSELSAWCEGCLAGTQARVRRALRAESAPAPAEGSTLFALPVPMLGGA